MTTTSDSNNIQRNQSISNEIKELLIRFDATLNAMDVEAIIKFYTEDITLFPPDQEPIKGKEAVKAWTEAIIEKYLVEEYHHPVQSMDGGEFVVHWGNATGSLTSRNEGEEVQFNNKYIHVFRRDSNGNLKLVWGMFNPNPV